VEAPSHGHLRRCPGETRFGNHGVNLVALLEGEPHRRLLDAKGWWLDAIPAGGIEHEARLRDIVPERKAENHDGRMKPGPRTIEPEDGAAEAIHDTPLEALFQEAPGTQADESPIERTRKTPGSGVSGVSSERRNPCALFRQKTVPPRPFTTRPSKPSFRKPPGPRPSPRKVSP